VIQANRREAEHVEIRRRAIRRKVQSEDAVLPERCRAIVVTHLDSCPAVLLWFRNAPPVMPDWQAQKTGD
jgi:hypothetical protein